VLRVLPLCDECGRRIEARRRSPFHDAMCRRCYAKTWLLAILELVPI
jgi:NMD protein affecting ribosome stability and mRNA decay